MKWFKRLTIVAGIIVIGLVLAMGAGWHMLRGTPDWYQPGQISEAEREQAAQRLTNKLADLQNQAALARRDELDARRTATQPSAASTLTISFTEEELNAFFQKWSALHNWNSVYGRYLQDPVIVLQNRRIILAGKLPDDQTVASLHLRPGINDDGDLELQIARITGGRLPLPVAVIDDHLGRVRRRIQQSMPRWQRDARIDPQGSANTSAIYATLGRMAIRFSDQQPADAVLFLPLMDKGTMPGKLTHIDVGDRSIELTVQPMSPQERTELVNRLRNGERVVTSVQ
jgi:hypothetical protein